MMNFASMQANSYLDGSSIYNDDAIFQPSKDVAAFSSVASPLLAYMNNQNANYISANSASAANRANSIPSLFNQMRSVGISPSAASQGLSNASPAAQPFTANSGNSADLLQSALSYYSQLLEDVPLANKSLESSDYQNANIFEDTMIKRIEKFWRPQLLQYSVDNLIKDGKISDYTAEILRSDSEFRDAFNEENLQLVKQNFKNLKAQYDVIKAEYSEKLANIAKIKQDTATSHAQETLYTNQANTEVWRTDITRTEYEILNDTKEAKVNVELETSKAKAAEAQSITDCFNKLGVPLSAAPLFYAMVRAEEQGKLDKFIDDLNSIQFETNRYQIDIDAMTFSDNTTTNAFKAMANLMGGNKNPDYWSNRSNYRDAFANYKRNRMRYQNTLH